jgi:malate dehydrogenase
MTDLAVLGTGRIGGEVAYLAAVTGLAKRLVLYDNQKQLLQAQVLDLLHTGIDLEISTSTTDVRDCDICIFAAGIARDPTVKTRADLLQANIPAAHECGGALRKFEGVLITVTNPMDANNRLLKDRSGLDPCRCIGFGCQVDSARFSLALNEREIAGAGSVLGEHGEHQVPIFSRLNMEVSEGMRDEILGHLRTASMEVITGKGGTVFGPAYHIIALARAVALDQRVTLCCSCILAGEYGHQDISIGVPAVIGREGVHQIEEWNLDPWEERNFDVAAQFIAGLYQHTR